MQTKKAFKKILVPIDGSPHAVAAREIAADLAKKFNSKITLLNIVSHELMSGTLLKYTHPEDRHEHPHVGFGGGGVYPPPTHAPEVPDTTEFMEKVSGEITEQYREEGEDLLSDAINALKEDNIEADKKLVVHADPANTILNEAENHDMIIIGNAGEEDKEPHLGSVAKKVAHRAKIPVLVARGKRDFQKILVPVDGSDYSFRTLDYVNMLAAKTNAKVTLLYVQETGLFRVRPAVSKEIGNRILSAAARELKEMKPEQKLESGDPAKTIIKTAKNGNYDIIIIGSRGHSTTEMFTLGSVSDHVVQYADRPVLITK